jgi:hypothetical protein
MPRLLSPREPDDVLNAQNNQGQAEYRPGGPSFRLENSLDAQAKFLETFSSLNRPGHPLIPAATSSLRQTPVEQPLFLAL